MTGQELCRRYDGVRPDPSAETLTIDPSMRAVDEGGIQAGFTHELTRFPDVLESVLDIKRVTYRGVQLGTFSNAEMADPAAGQQRNRQSHDVVASDHTHFGQPFFGANFDLRSNPPNSSRNRGAGDSREDLYGRVSS